MLLLSSGGAFIILGAFFSLSCKGSVWNAVLRSDSVVYKVSPGKLKVSSVAAEVEGVAGD